jgi:hypothetical protein
LFLLLPEPTLSLTLSAAVVAALAGLLKTLASDTHWNVRAEVPDMLINLLAVIQHNQQHSNLHNASSSQSNPGQSNNPGQFNGGFGGSFDPFNEQQQPQQPGETSHTAAAVGEAAAAAAAVGGFTPDERKSIW